MMIRFLTEAPQPNENIVLALGVFDAVHLGHREIIAKAAKLAKIRHAKLVAVTFSPHPREVLLGAPPVLLLPLDIRIELLKRAGADAVGMIEFSRQFADLRASDFCQILAEECSSRLVGLVVGSQWRFGRGGEGEAKLLRQFFAPLGAETIAVEERSYQNRVISASRIREAISQGDFAVASAMLGRSVALYGRVEHGFGEAGALLDAPTLNLQVDAGVLPPNGVYAGRIELADGRHFAAAVNCGIAPTFGDRTRRVEAHLLDFSGDLYGSKVKLELLCFIRNEKQFPSVTELKKQIESDIEFCREALK